MKRFTKNYRSILSLIASLFLAITQFSFLSNASAQVNTISVTLAAAEPTSYSHATGGGYWAAGRENIDIKKSLEGGNFECEDTITYLTKVVAPNNPDLRANGVMTLDLNYSISMDSTGDSGVALGEPVVAIFNTGDTANSENGNSAVSVVNTSQTGDMFTKGAELLKTIRLTGVEAGESLIVRIDVKLYCKTGSIPSGNLQFRFKSGSLVFKNGSTAVNPAEPLNAGEQTISLKNVQALAKPSISIAKTVTTATGNCPGAESITIEPKQSVKFCYAVTNDSNVGGQIPAPLYNITQVFDDNGDYPDFSLDLTAGLTDLDSDGVADDLAIGATAYGEYVISFNGTQDSTVINTAQVSGFDKPTSGVEYSDTDIATVYIDAPAISLTLVKLTNGADGATILVGQTITWTYLLTNVGERDLSNVYVIDDKEVSVNCPANTLAVGANMTCTATGTATAGNYVNVGTAYGNWNGTQVSATDGSSYFGADPKIDIQKTPDSQTVVEGQKATFTITVTNTGNVDLTGVTVSDALAAECDKNIGALAVAGISSYTCLSPIISSNLTNVAIASGTYGTTQVSDTDSAEVVVDYLPNIEVTKTPDPISVLETGGAVTFTVSVKNKAPENFTLTSLVDDKFGDLNGQGTCSVPHTLSAGATYSCTFIKNLASDLLVAHTNVVTATGTDPEAHQGTGNDDATVNFTDVLPTISVTKTATPTIVRSTGEYVLYTIKIFNTGSETVTVTSLVDSAITLSSECLALVGLQIPVAGSIECSANVFMVIGAGNTFTNIATATAKDNENNSVSASGTAVIKSYWFGRTPGYWKNHPEAWISGYTPSQFVQSIFTIPSSLLSAGNLDLDGNKAKDTLLAGLAYKGGTNLSGAAQILLRAAIAGLLNEAYYGADYPYASTPAELIANVNATLASLDRTAYLALAKTLDMWNNGVEGPLP